MRVYYFAQHTTQAGKIFKVLHNNDEELYDILLTEDMHHNCIEQDIDSTFEDTFYDEYGWYYNNSDYNYVEGETAEAIVTMLTEDIEVWSKRPFNSDRSWQIKWRENIIADLED